MFKELALLGFTIASAGPLSCRPAVPAGRAIPNVAASRLMLYHMTEKAKSKWPRMS